MSTRRLKTWLLLILLGMPIILYLFLQGFGENEYGVPLLYENGIVAPLPGCIGTHKPHTAEPFIVAGPCNSWDCNSIKNKLVIFSFAHGECSSDYLEEVARVCNLFKNRKTFKSVTIELSENKPATIPDNTIQLYGLEEEVWDWWIYDPAALPLVRCGLNLTTDCESLNQIVLVDQDLAIRGYYKTSDPQEIDRLVAEIQILLMET